MKYLIALLLLTSCAGNRMITSGPEKTAIGAILDLRIEGYYYECDYVEVYSIMREDKDIYVGEGECIKFRPAR